MIDKYEEVQLQAVKYSYPPYHYPTSQQRPGPWPEVRHAIECRDLDPTTRLILRALADLNQRI